MRRAQQAVTAALMSDWLRFSCSRPMCARVVLGMGEV